MRFSDAPGVHQEKVEFAPLLGFRPEGLEYVAEQLQSGFRLPLQPRGALTRRPEGRHPLPMLGEGGAYKRAG
jgi:hypothetical protein